MPKVIYINAKEQRLEQKNVKGLEEMQALVDGYIEPVYYVKVGRSNLVVNEEGLYKGYDFGFSMDGHQFVGNGFVGTMGKTDTKVTAEELEGRITFLSR